MQLKKYDALNTVSSRKGNPTISFNRGGAIGISGEACKAIGLSEGDKVSLVEDEENPGDWYITKDKDGFPLRKSNAEAKGTVFNCAAISSKVLDFLNWQEKKAAICRIALTPVTQEKMKLYPILTASAKKLDF